MVFKHFKAGESHPQPEQQQSLYERKQCVEGKAKPWEYTELRPTDIALYTQLLSHAPKRPRSITCDTYEHVVDRLISNLPSHLRSKIPWLSSFCTLHHRMNPLPVIGILRSFQHEIDEHLPALWIPLCTQGSLNEEQADLLTALEDVSALWLRPEAFELKFLRSQRARPKHPYQSNGCGACVLAHMGGNLEVLVALGGFLLGRLKTNLWKRSKRIMWIEQWIRGSVEDHEEEWAVEEMWALGEELQALRKSKRPSSHERVGEHVERGEDQPLEEVPHHWHSPTQRTPAEIEELPVDDSHASHAGRWLARLPASDCFQDPGPLLRRPQSLQSSALHRVKHEVSPTSVDSQEPLPSFSRPSSVYSRNVDGRSMIPTPIGDPGVSGGHLLEPQDSFSTLIDLYRHSALPGSAEDLFEVDKSRMEPQILSPMTTRPSDILKSRQPTVKSTTVYKRLRGSDTDELAKTSELRHQRVIESKPNVRDGWSGAANKAFDRLDMERFFSDDKILVQTWI